MNVSRSGYYKWLNRKGTINNYKKNRIALAEEIKNIHKHHSTYGYRSIAQNIRNQTGWIFSNNLCHKVFYRSLYFHAPSNMSIHN